MPTPASAEINCSLVVSDYKWMTETLKTAQNNYNVRPVFNAKVIDDTVSPNQIINNVGTNPPLTRGALAACPDGAIVGAGFDGSNRVVFYKSSDLHSAAGAWSTTTILDSSANMNNAKNRVDIKVSEYISGTYSIDVWHAKGFGSGGDINWVWHRSDDGGVTWTDRTAALTGLGNSPATFCIAGMKPRWVDGQILSGAFFTVNTATGDIVRYMRWNGSSMGSQIDWGRDMASSDWAISSIDSYFHQKMDWVVVSGFHTFLEAANTNTISGGSTIKNFSLWLTALVNETSSTSTDLWLPPRSLFSATSNVFVNQNSYTFPTASVVAGVVNILFRMVTVSSNTQSADGTSSQTVTTVTNYALIQSGNGINFSYPQFVVAADGTQFNDDTVAQTWNSYTRQGNYFYVGGSGKLWEFIQNNIVADVTGDVVGYNIGEGAGQPSSIQLQIANQNNMWVGTAPTNPGASAISRNKKVVLHQGYFNANGVPELIPRNVYYIDDINQSVDWRSNDFTLVARDFYKRMKTTITKYAYPWFGPFLYTDIFDGSTLGNWSQIAGSWIESGFQLSHNAASASDATIVLNGIQQVTYGSSLCVTVQVGSPGAGDAAYVYAFFIDSNNWLRWKYVDSTTTWSIQKSVAGSVTTLDSGTQSFTNTSFNVYVAQYDYYKFNFYYGSGGASGNGLTAWTNTVYFKNSTNGEYDVSANVASFPVQKWTVGVGVLENPNPGNIRFSYFKYMQFNWSNSIADLFQAIGSKAKIFGYTVQNILEEFFVNTSAYVGTFTVPNRNIRITSGNKAVNGDVTTQIANGEFTFQAQVFPATDPTVAFGFAFAFRAQDTALADTYYFRVRQIGAGGYVDLNFLRNRSATGILSPFPANGFDTSAGTRKDSLNINLQNVNTYRIVTVDGWMYAFINSVMVAAWNDNNTQVTYLTTGYWGWSVENAVIGTNNNSTAIIKQMTSSAFWKQTPSYALNPGDDIENGILSLIRSVRAWIFSDLMASFKAIFLASTDASTFTYQNKLFAQLADNSDKEFISQVTVYGNGVSAIARNTTLMAGVATRESIIVDYTITTQQDAQNRANFELINANQFLNQYNPKQTMNVGAEIFDAVTVVNTGNNSSGVNSTTRVYGQKFSAGDGQNNEYSLEIQTGTL